MLFASCSQTTPSPIIFGLETGTVTTEEQELVPLAHFREAGYTQLFLIPVGVPNPDPAGLPLDLESRKRAVAAGTYAQGFEPQVILSPEGAVGTFMSNNVHMSGTALQQPYAATLSMEELGQRIRQDHAGKRIVVIATIDQFEDLVPVVMPDVEFAWPPEGEHGLLYLSSNGQESSVQPFAVVTEWEE